ncbi:hypothetical protein F5Y16DRAFT_425000 [Xylariaceae sp. FL0255]|nr:hypothetical protein F5Y16DRAFT_425000 [Xylariaceae sp. FL0255]
MVVWLTELRLLSCAYWMAKKDETPFLTIIWNNGSWGSPKNAFLRLNPEAAQRCKGRLSDDVTTSISPSPSFGKIAEGSGDAALWSVLVVPEVDEAIQAATKTVLEKRSSALIEVVSGFI